MMKNSEAPKERLTHYTGTLLFLLFLWLYCFYFREAGFAGLYMPRSCPELNISQAP